MTACRRRHQCGLAQGFTLIELLLSTGIISILASVVIVAINPSKQFAEAADAQRNHNRNQIEKAVEQYLIEYDTFPGDSALPDGAAYAVPICRASFAEVGGCINLDGLIASEENFLPCLPRDGLETNAHHSGYAVYQESGRPKVTALYLGQGAGGHVCEELPKPVGYWKLDEALGTQTADSSGYQHSGTLTNMAADPWVRSDLPAMQFGNASALHFDGVNDYVGIVDTAGSSLDEASGASQQRTVSLWVKFDNSQVDVVTEKGAAGNHFYMVTAPISNKMSWSCRGGGSTDVSENVAHANGIWIHYAGTFDGTTLRMWKDGVQQTETNAIGAICPADNDSTLAIGGRIGGVNWFTGSVDELRIYPVALTGAQILALARGSP